MTPTEAAGTDPLSPRKRCGDGLARRPPPWTSPPLGGGRDDDPPPPPRQAVARHGRLLALLHPAEAPVPGAAGTGRRSHASCASSSSAAPGSSSARCWRCASTCSRRPTATSCSSSSTRSGPSLRRGPLRSWPRSWARRRRRSSAAFESESFAAASIGQVHRAVLPTGERVAVKVQRPGIRETSGRTST